MHSSATHKGYKKQHILFILGLLIDSLELPVMCHQLVYSRELNMNMHSLLLFPGCALDL